MVCLVYTLKEYKIGIFFAWGIFPGNVTDARAHKLYMATLALHYASVVAWPLQYVACLCLFIMQRSLGCQPSFLLFVEFWDPFWDRWRPIINNKIFRRFDHSARHGSVSKRLKNKEWVLSQRGLFCSRKTIQQQTRQVKSSCILCSINEQPSQGKGNPPSPLPAGFFF